jgi:predicted acylesterase/phospholipase RssA
MPKISIALSGGGHRASLFGLGVLLYLADANKNRDVESISSVSGGSLTNGYVGQAGNYRQMSPDEFWTAMAPFADRIANRGTLWGSVFTWLYLFALAVSFVVLWGAFWLPMHCAFQWCVFVVGFVIWAKLLFERRGAVCGWAFAATLFSPNGKCTSLRDIAHDDIDHLICATDLHAGEHVYFSGRFICSYRFGWGTPADLRLDQAVQASASFPVGFPCRWLKTSRHDFSQGTEKAPLMCLIDGGVYDNMAEQWAYGLVKRKRRWKDLAKEVHDADELVVVNASGEMGFESVKRLGIPLLGELFTLLRVIDVMYDNTTSPRRLMLVDQFDKAARIEKGLCGALVTIEQSPFKMVATSGSR